MLSMEWFNANDWQALALTLKVSTLATLFALIFGVGLAWVFAHCRFAGRTILDAVLTLPMVLPPTVLGYYLLVLFGRRGALGPWLEDTFGLQLVFTWKGAVVAATVVAFPLIFKSARAAFESVENNLENAARSLGSHEVAIFFRISLPLAARGIIAGMLLAFARAMGEFGATLMLAGNLPGRTQTLSMAVYDAVQAGESARANLLIILVSIVCVTILALSGYLLTPVHRMK